MAGSAGRTALATAAVFLISLFVLAFNIRATRIGAAAVDPIAHVLAQDESTYVNSAIRMTRDGDWLNPKLMGRLFLFKAPLLQWLSAVSIESFGLGLLSVRLPALLMGAAGIAAVFAWTALHRTWPVAVASALLLVSDPIWVIFSRLCFTDVLASTLALLAMLTLGLDPRLNRRRSRILFGALAGAAILAKSIVGVLPFAALTLYSVAMRGAARPRVRYTVEAAALAFLVAAPWPVYQAIVHPQWFWIEFVRYQLLAVGVTAATGVTGYPLFYIRRLAVMDPVLCVFLALPAYAAVRSLRRREEVPMVAICWTLVVMLALAVFRGRSLSYLVLLLPALCIVVGLFLPRWMERRWPVTLILLLAAWGAKVGVGALPYSAQPLESANAIHDYYLQNRDTELIVAAPDDSFYAITIPLPRVRYCYVDSARTIAGFAPHYLELGIAVTPVQLANLPSLMPEFSRRLSAWGVRSEEPVASAILLRNAGEINDVVRTLPDADYNLPAVWESQLTEPTRNSHTVKHSGDRMFLLARGVHARTQPLHRLPSGW
jgi:4-amino-4-deoxy-L-arabinose transferase-like glycosyltransferase